MEGQTLQRFQIKCLFCLQARVAKHVKDCPACVSWASDVVPVREKMGTGKVVAKISCTRPLCLHGVCDALPQNVTVEEHPVGDEAPLPVWQNSPVVARDRRDLILCPSVCQNANSSSSHRSSTSILAQTACTSFLFEREVGDAKDARHASM